MMYKRETRADYGTGKREVDELAIPLEELSTATVWEAE